MAESAIWVKVFPSTTNGDTGGPGWDVLTAAQSGVDVQLSWPAAGGSPAGYEIVVDGQIQDVGNVLTKTVTGLTFGAEHTFKVRAYDAGGLFGGWSSTKSVTPSWSEATGGTVTDIPNYNGSGETWRVHTFTGNGTLTVTKSGAPFRVFLVGGGGGGGGFDGNWHGNGGSGGFDTQNDAAVIPAGAHAVVVGGGGTYYGEGTGSNGGTGGTSSIGNLFTAAGGPGGAGPGGNGGNYSGGASNGGTTTIRGTSETFGNGGPADNWPGFSPGTNTGNGGGGGHTGRGDPGGPRQGTGGAAGIVIIAYRIG